MKTESGQIQFLRVPRCSCSIARQTDPRADILIGPKGSVCSVACLCAQILILCFISIAHMNCDVQPQVASKQISDSPAGSAEMVDSSLQAGSDPNPTHLKDNGTHLNDNSSFIDEWPSDVPVYPGLSVVYLANMKDTISIQATADDAHGKVAAFYQTKAAETGWKQETTITEKQMVLLNVVKTKRKLSMVITEREGGATIALTLIHS